MTAMRFETSAKGMADARRLLEMDTVTGEKARLIVKYAQFEGGLTLQYWQLKKGPLFGTTNVCTMAWCAKELDVPLSRIVEINDRTWTWVLEQVEAWRPRGR